MLRCVPLTCASVFRFFVVCLLFAQHSGVITRYLCWVQSAQLLEPGSVADLLEAALQVGDTQAVRYICEELRGAQHLQAEHMTKLLLVGIVLGV